ncbi:hypothetical protein PENTCL1PPCAC_16522, partial [Pristionchus entomophagus]
SHSKLQTVMNTTVTKLVANNERANWAHSDDSREDEEGKTKKLEEQEHANINKWIHIGSALALLVTFLLLAYNIWALVTYYCTYIHFHELYALALLVTFLLLAYNIWALVTYYCTYIHF